MKVVDASAICAVLFAEEEERRVVARIGSAPMVAPTLLSYEVANACWMKLRRNPERRTELLGVPARVARLGIRHLEVNHSAVLLLAEATRLSAYDAAYVWLARALGVELVSLDRRVLQAAAEP